jgi:hypothetical protein
VVTVTGSPRRRVTGVISAAGRGSEVFHMRFTPSGTFRCVPSSGFCPSRSAWGVQRRNHRNSAPSPTPPPLGAVVGDAQALANTTVASAQQTSSPASSGRATARSSALARGFT